MLNAKKDFEAGFITEIMATVDSEDKPELGYKISLSLEKIKGSNPRFNPDRFRKCVAELTHNITEIMETENLEK